jgi:hypothetical protein
VPGKTAFRVTPKQGTDPGGWHAVRKLRLTVLCAAVLSAGVAIRLVDVFGPAVLPSLPGIAAIVVPLLGLVELRRVLRTLLLAGGRRQRRLVYRHEGDAPAETKVAGRRIAGRVVDASASGLGLVMDGPLPVGERSLVELRLPDAEGREHDVRVHAEVRSCRESGERWLVGARIAEMEADSRMRLMEWCYVVCSHERLRGRRRAGGDVPQAQPILVPADDVQQAPVRIQAPQPTGAAA